MKSLCLCLSLMITNAVASGDDFPAYVRITGHPNDAKVYAALETVVNVEFPGTSLEDVIAFFSKQHQISILMDSNILDEVGVDASSEVTWMEKGITLGECLNRNLPQQLGFIVQDGTLKITYSTDAATLPDVRMYLVPGDHAELLDELVHAIEVTFNTGTLNDGDTSITRFGNFLIVKEAPATHHKIQQLVDTIKKHYWP